MDCLASALGTRESASICAGFSSGIVSVIDGLLKDLRELLGLERHAADLGVRARVDEVLGAQQGAELSEVHLRHDHLVVTPQDLAEIPREGVEMAQMHLCDALPRAPYAPYRRRDRPVGRTPAHDQGVGL